LPSTDDLRRKAEAATPGPWEQSMADTGNPEYVNAWWQDKGEGQDVANCETAEDGAFIAAWHPGVALAALKVIEAADLVVDCDGAYGCAEAEVQLDAALREWKEAK